jgi:hypothetical protein
MGVTEEEISEALHIAMTVGATRMQVMLQSERSRTSEPPVPDDEDASDNKEDADRGDAAGRPVGRPPEQTVPAAAGGAAPTF